MANVNHTEDPPLWRLFDVGFEKRRLKPDPWHGEPTRLADGTYKYYWHASSLAGCPRKAILARAGLATEPLQTDSELNFAIGHAVHALAERFSPWGPEAFGPTWELVGAECGGAHPDIPLKARADMIYSWNGEYRIVDYKTESASSSRVRRESNEQVRREHHVQLAAGCIVAEALGIVDRPIRKGVVLYIAKPDKGRAFTFSQEEVDIDEEIRRYVMERVEMLERAWEDFVKSQELPERLGPIKMFGRIQPDWHCKPRGKTDPRGEYCNARAVCFSLPPEAE